jgi:hypothetical protein
LQSRATFLKFINLLNENDINLEFYKSSNTGLYRLQRY